jgi:ribosomal protein S18 acetylase RimI-like enzyme
MAAYIAEHQTMYPAAMHEGAELFGEYLSSTPFNWGLFLGDNGTMAGWVICTAEEPPSSKQVYWIDLAVLPEFQGRHYSKVLMEHAYKELRWAGQWVRMHCRSTAYPRNAEGLRRCGYEIVRDTLEPKVYCGEDLHELLLKPL